MCKRLLEERPEDIAHSGWHQALELYRLHLLFGDEEDGVLALQVRGLLVICSFVGAQI